MTTIDSHLHMWDPDHLSYPWLNEELNAVFGDHELLLEQVSDDDATIFVQAECEPEQFLAEIEWVESIADAAGVVAIVAGAYLDLGAETIAHLDAIQKHEKVVGVRHMLEGEPEGYTTTPEFLAGARELAVRGLTFDACVSEDQIPDVIALAEAVPGLRIVLDHIGKPTVGRADHPVLPGEKWQLDLAELATHPQVYCKLSGLPAQAFGDWSEEQLTPFLDIALILFGPKRIMWRSDWPVSSIMYNEDVPYQQGSRLLWYHCVEGWALRNELREHDVFAQNAMNFYGMY